MRTRLFVGIAAVSVVLDQVTKILVRQQILLGERGQTVIQGLFDIVHVENSGAAFGLLAGYDWAIWVFVPFTLIAVIVLISLLRECNPAARFMPAALGLILGGALGNFVDRVWKQSVTDFLRVYQDTGPLYDWLVANFGTAEYPSFNVADMSICLGVAMFVIHELTWGRKKRED